MGVDPALPPSLAAELADLKRRLANLERSPSLPYSSTKGGAFQFLDADGAVRRAEGNVNFLDGSFGGVTAGYGFFVYGDGGALIFMAREGDRGITYPAVEFPFHPVSPIAVTSGSFVTLWEHYVDFPAHEVLRVEMAAQTDAGTTGEVRLFENGNNQATSVASLPAAYNGTVSFKWLHPAPTGLYDPRVRPSANLLAAVQARRTGGAGNVTIYPPRRQQLTSKFVVPDAATNGNPQVS